MSGRGSLAVSLALCLAGSAVPGYGEPPLAAGIRQARDGEYAAAVSTLRRVAERLAADPQSQADLKTAHVYLAVAHLGLAQEVPAWRAFMSALKIDPALVLSGSEFSPRAVEFFEGVRKEALTSGAARPPSGTSRAAKWILVGGGAAAAATGAALLRSKSVAPTVGAVSVEPAGVGISGVTEFRFTVVASDANGDSLTYRWEFGDGVTADGPSVTHTYALPSLSGPSRAKVTVSDGQAPVMAQKDVEVKSLSGMWVADRDGVTRIWSIRQTGTAIEGQYAHSRCPGAVGFIAGQAFSPRRVQIQGTMPCWGSPAAFTGEADAALSVLTVSAEGVPLTFMRQSGQ